MSDIEQPQLLPTTEPGAGQPQSNTSSSTLFREIVETLLLTAVIFVLVNTVTGRFRIDGSSMEPNLHDGEYVIVNRVVYHLHAPERGDIIVFRRDAGGKEYIKRVIGLPGDVVQVQAGHVMVNGVPLDEPYLSQPPAYTMEPRQVAPNEYFVLGDNRNNSSDSHSSLGLIPLASIDGKAWVTYWPPKDWGLVPHYVYAQAKQQ
jgi:signal peptidase I